MYITKENLRDNIENTLIYLDTQIRYEFISKSIKPNFTDDALVASINIFFAIILDKMVSLQNNELMDMEDRLNMGEKLCADLNKILHTYTATTIKELNGK